MIEDLREGLLTEPMVSQRRARFLELMMMTRRCHKGRSFPPADVRPGVFLLCIMGFIVCIAGLVHFSYLLHTTIKDYNQEKEMYQTMEKAHTNFKPLRGWNGLSLMIGEAENIMLAGTKAAERIDSTGIVMFSIALASTVAAFAAFGLAAFGTWRERIDLLKASVIAFLLCFVLEVAALVKNANSNDINLFEGNYSTVIVTFTLLLTFMTLVMVWLHHRWLEYSFRRVKHVQQTPLFDGA